MSQRGKRMFLRRENYRQMGVDRLWALKGENGQDLWCWGRSFLGRGSSCSLRALWLWAETKKANSAS